MAALGVYYVFRNRDGESVLFQMDKESTPHRGKGCIICHFTGKWISTKFCGREVWLGLMHHGWAYTLFSFHVSLARLPLLVDISLSKPAWCGDNSLLSCVFSYAWLCDDG